MNKIAIFSLIGLMVIGGLIAFIFVGNGVIPLMAVSDQPVGNGRVIVEAEAATPVAKEFKIDAYKFYYSPAVITVKKGDKVKITVNNADVLHGIKIPDLGLSGNETVEFTADKAGEFTWYCNVYCGEGHQKMQGKLIVE